MSSIFSAVPIDNLPDATRCHCPNPPAPSDVIDWTSASHYLNHGQWLYARTLANNTRLLRLVHGHIAVRLHSSVVVVYPRPGSNIDGWLVPPVAMFTLAGYDTDLTRRRIMVHTPGAFWLSRGEGAFVQHFITDPLDSGIVHVRTFASAEVVSLGDAGDVRNIGCWPFNEADFHPKAKRPYRTRRKRGGKKQTVAHFTSGGSGHLEPGHLYELMDKMNKQVYQQQPKAPLSPQVNGERVRSQLSQAVPDMNRGVRCPEPIPTFDICREIHSLARLLVHLNDMHRWTREAIADWLEAQDLDLEFRPPPAPDPPTTYTPF